MDNKTIRLIYPQWQGLILQGGFLKMRREDIISVRCCWNFSLLNLIAGRFAFLYLLTFKIERPPTVFRP